MGKQLSRQCLLAEGYRKWCEDHISPTTSKGAALDFVRLMEMHHLYFPPRFEFEHFWMLHRRSMEEGATHSVERVCGHIWIYSLRGRRCGCGCDQCIVSCRMMPSDLNSVEVLEILEVFVFTGKRTLKCKRIDQYFIEIL